MTNDSKKEAYEQDWVSKGRVSRAVGLGLVSAASAIAGGLAVAWWYRKTLTKFQNPIAPANRPNSEFPDADRDLISLAESDVREINPVT